MNKRPERPTWDEYFLEIAKVVSRRSSCLRKQVGAVIVHNKDIISTGYNGAPSFQKNSLEYGFCYRETHNIQSGTNLELCRAVGSHAESNAIVLAARNGHSTADGTMYVYGHEFICNMCKAMIANAFIKRVVLQKPDGSTEEFFPEQHWTVHPVDKAESPEKVSER
ncbi:MAG: dCMP deaminase family protein [Candidatus Marinimicrobia bacterium]|nr:dCMP deaminase family protein [Candidatus Neomarinimicrobiota bacterium]